MLPIILFITVATGLFGNITLSSADASEISGIISVDTTWVNARSPYYLMGPISVARGVTLSIEPGVTVHMANGGLIQINGTIVAKGTPTDKISLVEGKVVFSSSSTPWTESNQSGCVLENTVVGEIQIENASPKLSQSLIPDVTILGGHPLITGCIVGASLGGNSFDILGGSPVIRQTLFNGSQLNVYAGSPLVYQNNFAGINIPTDGWNTLAPFPSYGITLQGSDIDAYISDNTVTNHAVAGIKIASGSAIIQRNLIDENARGIIIDQNGRLTIQNNTITNNTYNGIGIGAAFTSNISIIAFNNFKGNGMYNLNLALNGIENGSAQDLHAENNWWGTTNTSEITNFIYDFQDAFTLGAVYFAPVLTSPNLFAIPDSNAPLPTATLAPTPSPIPPTPTPIQTSQVSTLDSTTFSPDQQNHNTENLLYEVIFVLALVVAALGATIGLLLRRSRNKT
jgi:hypothetical protein